MDYIQRLRTLPPDVLEVYNDAGKALEHTPPPSACFAAPEDWSPDEAARHNAKRRKLLAIREEIENKL